MEAQTQGGAEVRKLHIVYYLSRKGRIEHPHLIRVLHLSRNGVRLKDVKRWLSELRGKEITESFAWSYKRVYKTNYVWQDLLDDDLITPISDNEYVLKGSEIISSNIKEEKVGKQKKQSLQEDKALCKEENQTHSSETSLHVSTEIEEESPSFGSETSTMTDETGRAEVEKSSDPTKQEKATSNDKVEHTSPFYWTLLSKKSKKRSKNVPIDEKTTKTAVGEAEAVESSKNVTRQPQCTSKNNTNSASKMLKNLISCGDVHTNDSAVLPIKKPNKPFLSMCSNDLENVNSTALSKRDNLFGGSQRVFGNPTWTQQPFSGRRSLDGIEDLRRNKSKSAEQKASCAAYKPVNRPNCSQCGKVFKPEKMHAHMKSCKGLKALSKCSAADNKASKGSAAEFRNVDSFSGHLLTH